MSDTVEPQRKWFWIKDDFWLMPQEVEMWHPSLAYPIGRPNTRILWPYNALFDTEEAALLVALQKQREQVTTETEKLELLERRLAVVRR